MQYMFWFITYEDSKVYKIRFIDTMKTLFFDIAWLHSSSLKWYVLTLYIILSLWSLFKLLTQFGSRQCNGYYTTQPIVDWIGLWASGTSTTMQSITYKLTTQPYFLFFIEGFGLCIFGLSVAMRDRCCSSLAP